MNSFLPASSLFFESWLYCTSCWCFLFLKNLKIQNWWCVMMYDVEHLMNVMWCDGGVMCTVMIGHHPGNICLIFDHEWIHLWLIQYWGYYFIWWLGPKKGMRVCTRVQLNLNEWMNQRCSHDWINDWILDSKIQPVMNE